MSAYEDEKVVTSVYRGQYREMESVAIFQIWTWVRVKNGPKTQARDRVFGRQQGSTRIGDLGSAPMPTLDIWTPSFRLREQEVEIIFIIAPLRRTSTRSKPREANALP